MKRYTRRRLVRGDGLHDFAAILDGRGPCPIGRVCHGNHDRHRIISTDDVPAHLLASEHVMVRICARLMGTEFSFVDLITYAVGIAFIFLADSSNA